MYSAFSSVYLSVYVVFLTLYLSVYSAGDGEGETLVLGEREIDKLGDKLGD